MPSPAKKDQSKSLPEYLLCPNGQNVTEVMRAASFSESASAAYQNCARLKLIHGSKFNPLTSTLTANELKNVSNKHFRELACKALGRYEHEGLDDEALRISLSHLLSTSCPDKILCDLTSVVELYSAKKFKLAGLIESTSTLVTAGLSIMKCSPDLLESFGIAYQWMGIQIPEFSSQGRYQIVPEVSVAIDQGLKPEGIFAFCSILSRSAGIEPNYVNTFVQHYASNSSIQGASPEDTKLVYKAAIKNGLDLNGFSRFVETYRSCMGEIHAHWTSQVKGKEQSPCAAKQAEFKKAVEILVDAGVNDTDFMRILSRQSKSSQESSQLQFRAAVRVGTRDTWSESDSNVFRVLLNHEKEVGLDHHQKLPYVLSLIENLEFSPKRQKKFIDAIRNSEVRNTKQTLKYLAELCLEEALLRRPKAFRPPQSETEAVLKGANLAIEKGKDPTSVITEIARMLSDVRKLGKTAELTRAFSDYESLLEKDGNGLAFLSNILSMHLLHGAEEQISLFVKLVERFGPGEAGFFAKVRDICTQLAAHDAVNAFSNFASELEADELKYSFEDFTRAVADISIRKLVNEYSRSDVHDFENRHRILSKMTRIAKTDVDLVQDLPGGSLRRAYEVIALQTRINTYHEGFLGLSCDAQRKHNSGGFNMIERFAKAAGELQRIYTSDTRGNPGGPGFAVSHIEPERIFAPDFDKQWDKFHAYKENWPQYRGVIDSLGQANFCGTLGWLLMSVPQDERMKIANPITKVDTHYSLIVFSDHHGSLDSSAFLVETKKFTELLRPCLYDPELAVSVDGQLPIGLRDINDSGLTASDLLELQKSDPFAVINVGSSNAVLGGFMNSLAVSSGLFEVPPEVQPELNQFGTPNVELKSYSNHGLRTHAVSEFFHEHIKQVLELNLNYMDLCMVSLSQFKKGYVMEKQQVNIEDARPDDSDHIDAVNVEEKNAASIPSRDRRLLLLLEEARAYRAYAIEHELRSEDYKVFGLCEVDNLSAHPQSRLSLDTETEILVVNGREFQLNLDSGEISAEDKNTWFEHVVPEISDYFTSVRFYSKSSLLLD